MLDRLDKEEIRRITGGDFEVFVYDTIDSTNSEAKRILGNYKGKNLILTSDMQEGGRGRQGKSFVSPKGNIYFSVVLHPEKSFAEVVGLTTFASLCLCEAIEEVLDIRPGIKWINDIYIDGKKVSGILCEAVASNDGLIDSIIIGIGVNVYPFEVPPELKDIVGFLNSDRPCRNEIIGITANKLKSFDFTSKDFMKSVVSRIKKRSIVIGKPVRFITNGIVNSGIATDIDETGGLVVQTENGPVTLRSGEITLRVDGSAGNR